MTKISLLQAKQTIIKCQLLDKPAGKGKAGALKALEHLGYVQIDTISVIERAHHHVFWSRCPDHKKEHLHELQAKDRKVFEYWGHAASFLPMSDFRYSIPVMEAHRQRDDVKTVLSTYKELSVQVLDRIKREGALSSSDFETPEDFERGPWWGWKPAKQVLEALFWTGELMVSHRKNFQRYYDLPERVIPSSTNLEKPDETELAKFRVRAVLRTLGFANTQDICWMRRNKVAMKKALQEMIDEGEATEVGIEGLDGTYYCLTNNLSVDEEKSNLNCNILSPFDNAVIRRDRLGKIFGLEYSLECYVPPSKRKFGYFALPILLGADFVGLLDAKAERKSKTLLVQKIMLDKKVALSKPLDTIAKKLNDFAKFNGCEKISVLQAEPHTLGPKLEKLTTDKINL
jgi:uncharacterized protein YcaQ